MANCNNCGRTNPRYGTLNSLYRNRCPHNFPYYTGPCPPAPECCSGCPCCGNCNGCCNGCENCNGCCCGNCEEEDPDSEPYNDCT